MFPLHGEELHSCLQGLVDLCPGFDTSYSNSMVGFGGFFVPFQSVCFVSSSWQENITRRGCLRNKLHTLVCLSQPHHLSEREGTGRVILAELSFQCGKKCSGVVVLTAYKHLQGNVKELFSALQGTGERRNSS